MTQFEKFQKAFDEKFGSIEEFMYNYDYKENDLKGKLLANLDESYPTDSYGESSGGKLERIIYFEDFDVYVKFSGTYSSYDGDIWYTKVEVAPKTKVLETFEEVK